jgi:hypothetical protein
LLPIVTIARLSIQTPSPIHEWLPIVKNHGYLICTLGLITILDPTVAPNKSSIINLKKDGTGIDVLKNKILKIYHAILLATPPPG